jgi:hypothetical protein
MRSIARTLVLRDMDTIWTIEPPGMSPRPLGFPSRRGCCRPSSNALPNATANSTHVTKSKMVECSNWNLYVPDLGLFFKKRCQKRNRREIKKIRKSNKAWPCPPSLRLNEYVIEENGSCDKRQSLRALLLMPLPFSGPLG